MSLRHGLLGLLAEGPASGYDLARRFQESLGLVWPAQHPRIYVELTRLAKEGLAEVESHGPRGRKAYRITDAGMAEVRQWLTTEDTDHALRMETLQRAYFCWLMEPGERTAYLQRERAHFTAMAATLRGYAESKDRGEWGSAPPTRAMRVAIEAGIRVNEALADWARWAEEADVMSDTGFGTHPAGALGEGEGPGEGGAAGTGRGTDTEDGAPRGREAGGGRGPGAGAAPHEDEEPMS
ncbi:PadR family transcriptional regulator [Streptomonospora nanhaiensis]|uniref:DNA-binding PadR family transcriptional regulator n=1 Tax=Streptomonospora nanhaiensis TaxID=1323731 RepID=A0A853BPW5_9ACTN|nr:PadR family transcriptional regulator [Streptomonospora nanhaiensis]MBV2365202.1 PadR family transcriptional regulator [Streptomonospora nanhaiensis]MBX9387415.1 PadR family transcriptional regulator [Streptomonospora nanhaiensis]NYI97478.1 DNA-binding PadR family transcriptional regulator [Streptomonospora nanhaiensis]